MSEALEILQWAALVGLWVVCMLNIRSIQGILRIMKDMINDERKPHE